MPTPSPSRGFSGLRTHRWTRRLFWAVLSLLALWLLSWWLVPVLAKGPLERQASALLGRPVTVGALEFQPWSLEITLRDIAVGGLDGAPPQLQIARVYADGELQSLLRLAPVVDALAIEAPHLRLALLADGHYDVDDILARFASPADAPPSAPARLAFYNLTLSGGSIDFSDATVGTTHTVRQLALQVPFISTLPSQREIKVEPHLSFELAGSRFSSSAQATPFTEQGKGQARVQWNGLDLAPYLPYLPASLPVRLQGGVLDLDLTLAFEQKPQTAVKLSGTVQAHKVRIADRALQPLLSWERLGITLDDVRPLDQVLRLGKVELDAPVLHAARDASGGINLAQLAAAKPAGAPAPPVDASAPASASAPTAPTPAHPASAGAGRPTPPAWAVSVAQIAVRQGTLHWTDAGTQPAAALQASGFTLDASALALPFEKPFPFQGSVALQDSTLGFEGEATDQAAQLKLVVKDFPLAAAAPYLAQTLGPALDGRLNGALGLQWKADAGTLLAAGPLALTQLALREGKTTLASVSEIAVEDAQVDLDARSVAAGRLAISGPQLDVERGADGRWMFERWTKGVANAAPATTDAAAKPWRVQIAQASVEGGNMG